MANFSLEMRCFKWDFLFFNVLNLFIASIMKDEVFIVRFRLLYFVKTMQSAPFLVY